MWIRLLATGAEARLSGVGPVVGSLVSRSKCLGAAAARMWSGFGRAVSVTSMTPVAPVCGHPSLPSCQGTLTPAITEFFCLPVRFFAACSCTEWLLGRLRHPHCGGFGGASRVSTWSAVSLATGAPPARSSAGPDTGPCHPAPRGRQGPCSRGTDLVAARFAVVALPRGPDQQYARLFSWACTFACTLVGSVVRLAG